MFYAFNLVLTVSALVVSSGHLRTRAKVSTSRSLQTRLYVDLLTDEMYDYQTENEYVHSQKPIFTGIALLARDLPRVC